MRIITPIMASAAVLALANVAVAAEPTVLTDVQMERVTAAGTTTWDIGGSSRSGGSYRADSAWNDPAASVVEGNVVATADGLIVTAFGGTSYGLGGGASAASNSTGPGDIDAVDGRARFGGRGEFFGFVSTSP